MPAKTAASLFNWWAEARDARVQSERGHFRVRGANRVRVRHVMFEQGLACDAWGGFLVDSILSERGRGASREALVKWRSAAHSPSWEPWGNLHVSMRRAWDAPARAARREKQTRRREAEAQEAEEYEQRARRRSSRLSGGVAISGEMSGRS